LFAVLALLAGLPRLKALPRETEEDGMEFLQNITPCSLLDIVTPFSSPKKMSDTRNQNQAGKKQGTSRVDSTEYGSIGLGRTCQLWPFAWNMCLESKTAAGA
jgi:hypothetical protein